MVGRERLPLPTFRTDDWPLPVGVSYSKEAQQQAGENLDELKTQAEWQAIDRKLRQLQIELPALEHELYVKRGPSNVKGLVAAKIARIETILDELQKDDWLSRQIAGQPDLVGKIEATRQAVEAMKAQAANPE